MKSNKNKTTDNTTDRLGPAYYYLHPDLLGDGKTDNKDLKTKKKS